MKCSEVDALTKMDSCRLVPLYNLIKYHISRGAEECKHTEQVSTKHSWWGGGIILFFNEYVNIKAV